MGAALPVVSDCRASCDCTTTLNVTELIDQAIQETIDSMVGSASKVVFDNAPELRSNTSHPDRKWIYLRGLVTPGDGMGGEFTFYADSVLADNDISVFKPDDIDAADPGRYIKEI